MPNILVIFFFSLLVIWPQKPACHPGHLPILEEACQNPLAVITNCQLSGAVHTLNRPLWSFIMRLQSLNCSKALSTYKIETESIRTDCIELSIFFFFFLQFISKECLSKTLFRQCITSFCHLGLHQPASFPTPPQYSHMFWLHIASPQLLLDGSLNILRTCLGLQSCKIFIFLWEDFETPKLDIVYSQLQSIPIQRASSTNQIHSLYKTPSGLSFKMSFFNQRY